jgi:hypothetical protein
LNIDKLANSEQTKKYVAKKLGITLDQLEIAISKVKAGSTWGEALASIGLTKALTKEMIVQKAGIVGKMATVLASKLLGKAKDSETASVWANNTAWYANPIIWIAAVIIGVVAAIAALVAGITKLTEWLNADAIAAEKAQQAAEHLAESYNNCKQEYEDMIAAFDNYKSAREALDNLTEGTEEYE